MREAGDPRYDTSQLVEDIDYASYAALLGFTGVRVERPEEVPGAWADAFAADRPVLLDVRTDPNVPPLPPHISVDQARGFITALVHRDPDAGAMIEDSLRALGARLFAEARDHVTASASP